jgi:hypothetical protein
MIYGRSSVVKNWQGEKGQMRNVPKVLVSILRDGAYFEEIKVN